MKFEWKKGSRQNADPQKVGNAIEKIRKRDGSVTTAAVVKAARPKNSPLHKCFQWDDSIAAEKYRQYQAGAIIRHLQVRHEDAPKTPTRAYEHVSVTEDDGTEKRAYQDIETIMSDPISRDELLARAICEAISFRKRYRTLSELAKVFAAMDEVFAESDTNLAIK